MKKHLYVHYYHHSYQIIITILWSWAIVLNRSLYNIIDEYRKWDMKYNFVARRTFPDWQAPIQVLLTAFDILCPIGVCLLNIKTINFEKYLTELMKAWQLEKYWEVASIYIRVNTNYENTSSQFYFNESLLIDEIADESIYSSLNDGSECDEHNSSYKSNYEQIKKLNQSQKIRSKFKFY